MCCCHLAIVCYFDYFHKSSLFKLQEDSFHSYVFSRVFIPLYEMPSLLTMIWVISHFRILFWNLTYTTSPLLYFAGEKAFDGIEKSKIDWLEYPPTGMAP